MTYSRGKSTSQRASHFRGQQAPRRQRVRHGSLGLGSPRELANLEFWYDFSDATTLFQDASLTTPVTADGQEILSVADKSGNARTLSEATNGPAYKTARLNGKSTSLFAVATTDQLTAVVPASLARTVFILVKKSNPNTAANRVQLQIGGVQADVFTNSGNGAGWLWYSNAAGSPIDFGGTVTNWTNIAINYSSAASLTAYADGGTGTSMDPHDIVTTGTSVVLGRWTAANGQGDCEIAEVIGYNESLSAPNMNLVGNYLVKKWTSTWVNV